MTSDWDGVHSFCEAQHLPCILPVTNSPFPAPAGDATLYFSRGLHLEADLFVDEVRQQASEGLHVTQLYQTNKQRRIADYVAAQLEGSGVTVHSQPATQKVDDKGLASNQPHWLMIWSHPNEVADKDTVSAATRIFAPSGPSGWPGVANDNRWFVLHNRTLPFQSRANFSKVKPWLKRKGLEQMEFVDAKMNALFTATLVSQTFKHIGSNFERRYFMDRLEHVFDNMLLPSAYPKLTLAPGQRHASRGGYVVPAGADRAIQQTLKRVIPNRRAQP
jgi:hypothetical protein